MNHAGSRSPRLSCFVGILIGYHDLFLDGCCHESSRVCLESSEDRVPWSRESFKPMGRIHVWIKPAQGLSISRQLENVPPESGIVGISRCSRETVYDSSPPSHSFIRRTIYHRLYLTYRSHYQMFVNSSCSVPHP
jgi:hypothetical protein